MYTLVTPHFCASIAPAWNMTGQETSNYRKNVSHWVYDTYLQQVCNYKRHSKKELHFGTRHRISFTLKVKTHPQNNLTPLCHPYSMREQYVCFKLAKNRNDGTFGIIVAGRRREGSGIDLPQWTWQQELQCIICQKTMCCSSWVLEVNRNWKTGLGVGLCTIYTLELQLLAFCIALSCSLVKHISYSSLQSLSSHFPTKHFYKKSHLNIDVTILSLPSLFTTIRIQADNWTGKLEGKSSVTIPNLNFDKLLTHFKQPMIELKQFLAMFFKVVVIVTKPMEVACL